MPNDPTGCEILLAARRVDAPERAREYALAQLTPVVRAARGLRLACIEITFDNRQEEHRRYMVEVAVDGAGATLFVRERARTAEAAIDLARDRLERSLREWNTMSKPRPRKGPRVATGKTGRPPSSTRRGPAQPTGRRGLKPLTEEEAARQLDLSDCDLFFFLNAANDKWCVVFRRESGGHGFIDSLSIGL